MCNCYSVTDPSNDRGGVWGGESPDRISSHAKCGCVCGMRNPRPQGGWWILRHLAPVNPMHEYRSYLCAQLSSPSLSKHATAAPGWPLDP